MTEKRRMEIKYEDGREVKNPSQAEVTDGLVAYLDGAMASVKAGKTEFMAMSYMVEDKAKTVVMVDKMAGMKLAMVLVSQALVCECQNPACITHMLRENFVGNIQALIAMEMAKDARQPGETVQ